MEKIAKRKPIGMVLAALGALLLVIVVASSGFSVVAAGRAESVAELETMSANGGGMYRPFAKAEFDYATFSGLYLSDDEDVPQVWLMWGFLENRAVCFYLDANGEDANGDGVFDPDDAPEDVWGVEYVLRAAHASLHEHSEWMLGESIGDTASYYEMTEDEAAALFADGVLEAARSDLATMQVAFWVGLVMAAVGAVLLVVPEDVSLSPVKWFAGKGADVRDETYEEDAEDETNEADEEVEADEEDADVSDR